MNKQEIRFEAQKRMRMFEERYCDYVTPETKSYYLLLSLIETGDLHKFLQANGWVTLHMDDCNEGKAEAGLGPLTAFERDCIEYLNAEVQRRESHTRLQLVR